MKARTIATEVIVLLLTTLMVISSFSVANTHQGAVAAPEPAQKAWLGFTQSFDSKDIVYFHYDDGGLETMVGSSYPPVFMAIRLTPTELGAYTGDKFVATAWYHVVSNQSIPDHLYDAKIWTGDQTHPITLLVNDTNLTASGQGWVNHTLITPVTIAASTDYWIVIKCYAHPATAQNDYPMPFDTNPADNISLKSKWWHNSNNHPETDFYEVATLNGAWLLRVGIEAQTQDQTPPTTTCTLTGNMSGNVYITPVTVTLSATDDQSGVAYTKDRLDGGNWTNYTVAFTVNALGNHTVEYYSVDRAGNVEGTKEANFTIASPLTIVIKKGFGITAELTNILVTPMTSVAWSIQSTGGIILFGASASGTIPTIAAGATKKVHAFPFGLGPITITATAGGNSATATAFLIFILTV